MHLHNPVLAYEVGDEFMKYWYQAEQGLLDPFVLVIEGSIPNESLLTEGYWAALGTAARRRRSRNVRLFRGAGGFRRNRVAAVFYMRGIFNCTKCGDFAL